MSYAAVVYATPSTYCTCLTYLCEYVSTLGLSSSNLRRVLVDVQPLGNGCVAMDFYFLRQGRGGSVRICCVGARRHFATVYKRRGNRVSRYGICKQDPCYQISEKMLQTRIQSFVGLFALFGARSHAATTNHGNVRFFFAGFSNTYPPKWFKTSSLRTTNVW